MKLPLTTGVLIASLLATLYPLPAHAMCNIDVPDSADFWISPTGSDLPYVTGTYNNPKATLQGVHDDADLVPTTLTQNITIHVKGGTYPDARVDWTKLSTTYEIVIEACPDEISIFDGKASGGDTDPQPWFFRINPSAANQGHVTLRNLTIRNYHQNGVMLNNTVTASSCSNGYRTEHNVIDGCTFENIGNKLWPAKSMGFGAVNAARSSINLIANNRFANVENANGDGLYIHAIYAAQCATYNTIEHNSTDFVSGDPVKLRNGSDYNTIRYNYFNRSGSVSVINVTRNSGESPGHSRWNRAYGNVATFPYRGGPTLLKCFFEKDENQNYVECDETDVDFTVAAEPENLFELGEPASERIVAIVGGDFDQDGRDEIVAAFNYDGAYSGFTKVVSTSGSVDNRYFHKVLYANGGVGEDFFWDVAAMTSGDFDDDGDLELLTAFHASTRTSVYNGDGESQANGCTGNLVYDDGVSEYWRVTGLAAGDMDEDGDDDALTAFEKSNNTAIESGNGHSSLLDGPQLLSDTSSPFWRISAIGAGDFNDDGDHEVITAMHTTSLYNIYSGNGSSGVQTTTLNTDSASPYWETTATIGGDFNDDGTDELVTGMMIPGSSIYRLYTGNGSSTVAAASIRSSDSSAFYIRALGKADYDDDGNLDLLTAIEEPGLAEYALKIVVGNGANDHDDIATLYQSYFND